MVGRLLPVDGAVREELVDELQTAIGDAYAIERELGGDGMSRRYVTHRDGSNIRVDACPAAVSKRGKLPLVGDVVATTAYHPDTYRPTKCRRSTQPDRPRILSRTHVPRASPS